LVVAGGPAAHLLLAGATLAAARAWGGAWVLAAVLLLLTIGWNLVPLGLRREGRWLDADWLLAWAFRPRLALQRVALGELQLAIETGLRPREWDERWTRLAALERPRRASSHEVAGDILRYLWALDRGMIGDAGLRLARTFAGRHLLTADQCAAVIVEAAFFVARYRGRRALAARLLDVAPEPSSELGRVDMDRARAAVHLAAGQRAEAAASCDRALAALDGIGDMPPGLSAFDRDQLSELRDAAWTGESRDRTATLP